MTAELPAVATPTVTKPRCPKCGGELVKGGLDRHGTQRWRHADHREKGACKWNGTRPVGIEDVESIGVPREKAEKLHRKISGSAKKIRRYAITAAQNATPVFASGLQSLLTCCKEQNRQLIVIPYRYKNPTSMWSDAAEHDDWWAKELHPYLLDKRIDLNPHLTVLGDIKVQPTAEAPLNGFESVTGSKSAIIGHPRLELKTVPTPQKKLSKILTTTAAITEKNYIQSKTGKKGEFHHTFGACFIDVVGDVFHMRQINMLPDGSFIDLDREYAGDIAREAPPAELLAMGDTHHPFEDPLVMKATFDGANSIVQKLRPKVLVWEDVDDFYARNHHHKHEPFINYAKHHFGKANVEAELRGTFDMIDKYSPDWCTNVFVASNHPEALARWVKEADPRLDPENAVFWAETYAAMCRGTTWTETGASTIDPFAFWGKKMLKCAGRSIFLARDQSFTVKGIELTFHGDKGSNGAKGSRAGFNKLGVKTIVADSHSPGITGGCYQLGLSARYGLEYAKGGPSSWLQTHCVIYANGKRSLLNVIGGAYFA